MGFFERPQAAAGELRAQVRSGSGGQDGELRAPAEMTRDGRDREIAAHRAAEARKAAEAAERPLFLWDFRCAHRANLARSRILRLIPQAIPCDAIPLLGEQ